MVARRALKRFWTDQSGATAVEVGLIVALISIALLSALTLLGDRIKTAFTKGSDAIGT